MNDDNNLSRRNFFHLASLAIGSLMAAIIAIPAVSYILSPALKKEESLESIPLGPASKVEIGTPTLFKAKIQQKAGWIEDEQEVFFYVFTENGRDYFALSNICTHLGCRVRWVDADQNFACPCHNAFFGKDGAVISGPPPRALDRYKTIVENGQIFITGETL